MHKTGGGHDKDRGRGGQKSERHGPKQAGVSGQHASTVNQDLSTSERHAFKAHLIHLRRFRRVLRLALNAQEDLLLNGQREPEHGGVCRHLLEKVDRKCVEAALTRIDDSAMQVQLLEGVIQFNHDAALLILYLEYLERVDHRGDRIGPALAQALRYTAFSELSAAQMRRLMDVLLRVVSPASRASVFLGLLDNRQFSSAFQEHADELSDEVSTLLRPMAALRGALRGHKDRWAVADVRAGLTSLFEDPAHLALPTRSNEMTRLCTLALSLGFAQELGRLAEHPAVQARWRELVPALLSVDQEPAARGVLDAVRENQKLQNGREGKAWAEQWNAILNWPRLGPIACRGLEPNPKRGTQRPLNAVYLPTMQPVWLFVARDQMEAEGLAAQARFHERLWSQNVATVLYYADDVSFALPGIVGALAVGADGEPLNRWLRAHPSDTSTLKRIAAQGYALLRDVEAHTKGSSLLFNDALLRRFTMTAGGGLCLFNTARTRPVSQASKESGNLGEGSMVPSSLPECFVHGLAQETRDIELGGIVDMLCADREAGERQLAPYVSWPSSATGLAPYMKGGDKGGRKSRTGAKHEGTTFSKTSRPQRGRHPSTVGSESSSEKRKGRRPRRKKTPGQERRSDI